jgi:hypothetical protein
MITILESASYFLTVTWAILAILFCEESSFPEGKRPNNISRKNRKTKTNVEIISKGEATATDRRPTWEVYRLRRRRDRPGSCRHFDRLADRLVESGLLGSEHGKGLSNQLGGRTGM